MEIYRRYAPALLRKCQRMLQNRQDAEDVVQGLFMDMLSKGQTRADLPYLYRAVTNRCINFVRYRENRRRLLEKQDELLRGPVRIRCDEHVIGMELLLNLVDSLDPRSREILIFRYFDEMSQEEIASLLGTSRKTVGKRLKKIRGQVTELMMRSGGGS